jgi:hypothetical protein
MDCKDLKGDELKKCQEKNKRPNQQKDENRYTDGDAKVQLAALDKIAFKNSQAIKILEKKKAMQRQSESSKNKGGESVKRLSFGGTSLGGSRMRLHRKKNNRSSR